LWVQFQPLLFLYLAMNRRALKPPQGVVAERNAVIQEPGVQKVLKQVLKKVLVVSSKLIPKLKGKLREPPNGKLQEPLNGKLRDPAILEVQGNAYKLHKLILIPYCNL